MGNIDKILQEGTVLRSGKHEYEILKVLGNGSFGITYLANFKEDADSIPTLVALKEFFMSEINGREGTAVTNSTSNTAFDYYRSKFKKEACSLQKISHSGIIKVFDFFEANNTCYYSMEYITGGSLDDMINKTGPLKESKAVPLIVKIARALGFMHGQNMVHLDLKPGNIMLRDSETPVLIDFGLSKKYDEDGKAESSTTVGNGTPGYAPIEQSTQQKNNELPVTMDIYALGATLFKMLTGKRPDDASTLMNEGFPEAEFRALCVSDKIVSAVKSAMSPLKRNRPQNIDAFIQSVLKASQTDSRQEQSTKTNSNESTIISNGHSNQKYTGQSHKTSGNVFVKTIKDNWRKRTNASNVIIVITYIAQIVVIIVGIAGLVGTSDIEHTYENLTALGILTFISQFFLLDNRRWGWYVSMAMFLFYLLMNGFVLEGVKSIAAMLFFSYVIELIVFKHESNETNHCLQRDWSDVFS